MTSILGSPVRYIRSLFSSQDSLTQGSESVVPMEQPRNQSSKVLAFNRWKETVLSTKKVFLKYDTRAFINEIDFLEQIPIMVVDMINDGDGPTWHPGYVKHAIDDISADGWQVLDMYYNVKYTSPNSNILSEWWDTVIKEPPVEFFTASSISTTTGEINSTEKKMVSTTKHCLNCFLIQLKLILNIILLSIPRR
jgi:hypothetical protein